MEYNNVLVDKTYLTAVADAIRDVNESDQKYLLSEMPDAILSLDLRRNYTNAEEVQF